MGVNDRRRFRAFACFIHKMYPQVRTVADVAGGRGNVSYFLRDLGYDATVIDDRVTRLPSWMHREMRKESVKQGRLMEIPRIVKRVQDVDLRPFDLIVGLHPDEATEHVVREALEHGKDFAIVPCCVFPSDGIKRSKEDWCTYLMSLSADIITTSLPIEGSNRVLYRCSQAAKARKFR